MNKAAFLHRFHSSPPLAVSDDYPLTHAGRAAGVLVPLIDRPEGLTVLLTQRALHLAHHPGQISFPGGKQEKQDKDNKKNRENKKNKYYIAFSAF